MQSDQQHVVHVVGARPNFPKAAPVLAALERYDVRQTLVHTGQHYDSNLSSVFLEQLGMPTPDVYLGVGSGTHGHQTAAVMTALEGMFAAERPDLVVVYGDINSTAAAALVAAKGGIRLAHVEAGLRSFDRTMPEEINRVVVDRLADLLLTTSVDAVGHLAREGVAADRIHFVGNPMIDSLLRCRPEPADQSARSDLDLPHRYALATLHRPGNVDDDAHAAALVHAMHAVADRIDIALPLHPRGRSRLTAAGLLDHPRMHVVDPMAYLPFLALLSDAALVITDSGGIQEESTVLGVPCLTVRPNTERPVTITDGTNRLVEPTELPEAVAEVLAAGRPSHWPTPPLWDGHAGERIAAILARALAAGPA
ncbi:UDP-N-acetylglucosamine 2-epimerase (non-hydrolyzing) [Pseudactinotalea sp. HY160]|uniref:non-hydrolyzing UDP-N-acetylglucosamine 2-epimerase n=1 Tax=Pseudactinotalea sp. HY160 TaxID=2654490 RepID=UPI00128E5910|nr:UDP-N-acetylglucosamine 2-epimerase (non-hydrolyzing) [Pseudactinotalea sp. HY160]MPV50717.1 UDP-N-acetylglucosamine 2-epimerase (non-hydrolyzing) [Pseudactinotalea sp. HY160]